MYNQNVKSLVLFLALLGFALQFDGFECAFRLLFLGPTFRLVNYPEQPSFLRHVNSRHECPCTAFA